MAKPKLSDLLGLTIATAVSNVSSTPILKEIQEEQLAKQREQIKTVYGNILNTGMQHLQSHVAEVRNCKRIARQYTRTLKAVARALEYFQATGNPFPLMKATGQEYTASHLAAKLGCEAPNAKDKLWEVPSDFTTDTDDLPNDTAENDDAAE